MQVASIVVELLVWNLAFSKEDYRHSFFLGWFSYIPPWWLSFLHALYGWYSNICHCIVMYVCVGWTTMMVIISSCFIWMVFKYLSLHCNVCVCCLVGCSSPKIFFPKGLSNCWFFSLSNSCCHIKYLCVTKCLSIAGLKVLKLTRVFWLLKSASVLSITTRYIFHFVGANSLKCCAILLLVIQGLWWSLAFPQMLVHANIPLIPWDTQIGMFSAFRTDLHIYLIGSILIVCISDR